LFTVLFLVAHTAGIDFGAVRVSEEVKLQFVVKNRGKYEVSFQWV